MSETFSQPAARPDAGQARVSSWRTSPLLPVALVLLMVVMPTIALAWHGSPMEIRRHAFQAIVIWRVALLLLATAYLSEHVSRRARP